jgi:hypothetical protein
MRERSVARPINQIRAFLLERGIAVRQGHPSLTPDRGARNAEDGPLSPKSQAIINCWRCVESINNGIYVRKTTQRYNTLPTVSIRALSL